MKQITLTIKDGKKRDLLLSLLQELSFVEIAEHPTDKSEEQKSYDFFASAGLWKGREINGKELRARAWKRSQ
ncbi:MAG: hypothetical protein WA958_08895 [Tunicatimonas sp.]